MSTQHSMLRSAMDSLEEATRLLSRFEKRDIRYQFTAEDCHTLRSAATMAAQGARQIEECSGYVEALIFGVRK